MHPKMSCGRVAVISEKRVETKKCVIILIVLLILSSFWFWCLCFVVVVVLYEEVFFVIIRSIKIIILYLDVNNKLSVLYIGFFPHCSKIRFWA